MGKPRSADLKAAGAGPSVASVLKKQRAREPLSDWARVGIGTLAAAVGVVLLATVFRPPKPEEHPHYSEALRVLRNDGLESSRDNVLLTLQLIDAATKPYSERGFQIFDASEWPPQCSSSGRICRSRPKVSELRPGGSLGTNFTLVPLVEDQAKVWLIEDLISPEEQELMIKRVDTLDFGASPTNHKAGQDWRSSSTAMVPKDDPAFANLLRRAAALCGVPVSFVELPQVVRYLPGEQYAPHMDSEGPAHRHWTILLYLNYPAGGGATAFPLLRAKVEPWPRSAVFWENLRYEPSLGSKVRNYYSLHAGQAPTGSEPKLAVNVWIRNSDFSGGM